MVCTIRMTLPVHTFVVQVFGQSCCPSQAEVVKSPTTVFDLAGSLSRAGKTGNRHSGRQRTSCADVIWGKADSGKDDFPHFPLLTCLMFTA